MLAIERKNRLISYIETNGKAEVAELAKILNVVPETIRRDLKDLEAKGMLMRTHGGAVIGGRKELEYPVYVREMQFYAEKQEMCKKAAELIDDGDTIYVDNSSTLINLIRYIRPDLNVTLLTNSVGILNFAATLENNITIICSGGIFSKKNMSLSGSIAHHLNTEFFPNKAFISCHGISIEHGLTDGSLNEADFKRSMIKVSQKTFCVADHSKIGKVGPVKLVPIDNIDVLITDVEVSDSVYQQIKLSNPAIEILYSMK